MRKLLFLFIFVFSISFINTAVLAQSPKPSVLVGEVGSLSDNKIVLQTKDGAVDVQLSGTTEYKRVPPENPTLKAAVASSLTEVSVGDKIMVTGMLADDKKSIPAKAVYLMTKADISKRNESERQQWKTRGVSGRLVSVDPAAKSFTIAVRGMMGEQNVTVTPKLTVNYKRYAPNSVKFDEAKDSSFAELKVGDQIRALGDKSEDGASFKAERVVSGSFKTIAGTITAIDAAKNEVTIKDIKTNKPVTIAVNSNSILKKFPADMANGMAAGMAARQGGAQPPAGGSEKPQNFVFNRSQNGGQPQPATGTAQAPGQGQGMRSFRTDLDDLLERFPPISVADLKVGDAIAISASTGEDISHVTAIKLLAGVDPFLKAAQASGGRSAGGQGASFSIPGLDGGIGAP